jgi:hypothetical protein
MIRRQFSVITTAVLLATVFALGNSSAHGQQMYVADTGVLKVEAGQTLRLVATGTGSEPITVVFRRAKYVETSTGSVVRMQRVSETVVRYDCPPAGSGCGEQRVLHKDRRRQGRDPEQ